MGLPLCGLMTCLSHCAKLEAITVIERPASLFPRVVNARFASEVRGKHCASDVVVGCDTREFNIGLLLCRSHPRPEIWFFYSSLCEQKHWSIGGCLPRPLTLFQLWDILWLNSFHFSSSSSSFSCWCWWLGWLGGGSCLLFVVGLGERIQGPY